MKVAAFTLFEMILAMALLSIVIALVYTSVSMAGGRAQNYSKSASEHLHLLAFSQHLEEDMAKATTILWDDESVFTMVNYDGSSVVYSKKGSFLYREKDTQRDSIAVQQITVNALKANTSNKLPLLRELWVEVRLFGQPLPLYFFKEYYAANQLLML